MAAASDSRSAPSAQRQKPQLPVSYAAAPSGEHDVVSPGRRNLLGALAAAPLAAVAPASAGEAQDPHLEWLAEYYAERARLDAEELPDIGIDDAVDAYATCIEIQNRILDTEPTTMAGVAAQLMVIAETNHIGLTFGETVTRPVLQRAAKLLPVPTWYDCTSGES